MHIQRILRELQTSGFARLPKLLTTLEVSQISGAFDRLWARATNGVRTQNGSLFVCSDSPFALKRVVWACGAEPVLDLGADERFTQIAKAYLKSERLVQLISQAHFKMPGDKVAFKPHQDASNRRYGSDLFTDVVNNGSYLQFAVAVDPMTLQNGPLMMQEGSHKLGFVADGKTGEIPTHLLSELQAVELEPGDGVCFGAFTIHASRENNSSQPRRLLLQGYTVVGANRRSYPGCDQGRLI